MEKEDDQLSHRQSFGIIEKMILAAKNEHRKKGDGWLIWGWLLFAASVSSAVLMAIHKGEYIEYIWIGMLLIGLMINFALYQRIKRKNEVTSYVEELLKKFGIGFFISLFVIIAAGYISRNAGAFGYYYILYAFWMFIHGSAIRFRPLIVGAVVNWIAALAIFLMNDFFYVMIISSIAILIGYLVPGYLLRNQYHKNYKLQQSAG